VKTTKVITEPYAGRTIGILLCLSVVANLCLATRLMRPLYDSTKNFWPGPKSIQTAPERSGREYVANDGPAASDTATDQVASPFLWSEIESADYRQYIANLRAVGCPEATIHDIVAADLTQLFGVRAAAIWKRSPQQPYWKKAVNESPDPKQMRSLNGLAREQAVVLQDLLGARVTLQELIDTVYLQFFGIEQELAFLPEQKRQAAVQAVAGVEEEVQEAMGRDDYFGSQRELFTRRLEALAKVLSSAELDEFRLRNAPAAENLRMETRYFDCTPEEFKLLVEARMQAAKNEASGPDLLNRSAAAEQARKLIGEERAKEFAQKSELFYINARWAAEDQGLGVETGEAAWKVTRDTREAAARIAGDTPFSSTEGKAQLDELLKKTRTQLEAMLGPTAARSIVRDLRVVIITPPGPATRSP